MEWKKIVKTGIIIILLGFGTYGLYFLYRLDKPTVIKSFPDPFEFNNGTSVKTEGDWQVRREEIKELLLDKEYGHMPGRPDSIHAKLESSEERDDGSTLNEITLKIIPFNNTPKDYIEVSVWEFIPEGKGPFPTIVQASKGIEDDETIINKVIDRDFILVCYNVLDLDPDVKGDDVEGPCQEIYGDDYDWGSVAMWAWGGMRVADYLLEEPWVIASDGFPDIDSDALIITGHSRRGKAALLAGALDERFTMVVPNGSGCGGAGSFLVQGYLCETISAITAPEKFFAWFQEDFNKYGNNEEDLDFDQHFLLALVAPRIIISTNAFEDFWANPTGTQAIHEAVAPVFEFLDAEENSGIVYRHGYHSHLAPDFEVILDFAEKRLLDEDISGNFYMTPYDLDITLDYEAP